MSKNSKSASESQTMEETLIDRVLASRKYRALNIPKATVLDLIQHADEITHEPREIEQIVREKMHNLVAPYLGDPDYEECKIELDQAYEENDIRQIKEICLKILSAHASTRERNSILDNFYQRIFAFTGVPDTILDLACGLNPFALPWMNLKPGTKYYAYDLHQPRLDLIGHFLTLNKMEPLAFHQDILVEPPQIEADVAFFFKEAHRFEQRRRGCNRAFWQSLKCKYLLVSLPTASLTGKHPKTEQHRRLVMETIAGLPWKMSEIEFSNEIIFCIEKSG